MTGRPILTWAILGLLTLIWGTTWAAIRIGLQGIPPFAGVALRFGIAGVLLLFLAQVLKVELGRSPRERWLWLSNAVLTFAGPYGIVYWAEQWIPSSLASVLFATFPLFVAVMAHFWLPGERLTVASALGVAVGFAGVWVIFSEDLSRLGGEGIVVGSGVMLLSPLLSAIGQVIVKRWGGGIHPVSLTALPMVVTAGSMGLLSRAVGEASRVSFDLVSVGALLYLAVFGSAVTFSLYFWLLSQISATRLSLIAYAIPVVAVGVGTLALDETLTGRTLVGAALVVGGVALAVQAGLRRAATPPVQSRAAVDSGC